MQSKWVVFVVYFLSSVRASKFFYGKCKKQRKTSNPKMSSKWFPNLPCPKCGHEEKGEASKG